MTKYSIVYWRDIPVHIKVRIERTRFSSSLSPRFQKAVYRAAYRAKAISGFDYINEWRLSDWQEQEDTAEHVMSAVKADLEAAYSDERLDKLARNKGFEPQND